MSRLSKQWERLPNLFPLVFVGIFAFVLSPLWEWFPRTRSFFRLLKCHAQATHSDY